MAASALGGPMGPGGTMGNTIGPIASTGQSGTVGPSAAPGMLPTTPDSMMVQSSYQGVPPTTIRNGNENGTNGLSKSVNKEETTNSASLSNEEDASESPPLNSTLTATTTQTTTTLTSATTVSAPMIRQTPIPYPGAPSAYGMPPPGYQGAPGYGYPGLQWGVPPQGNPYLGKIFFFFINGQL